jgi:hypothetical protein
MCNYHILLTAVLADDWQGWQQPTSNEAPLNRWISSSDFSGYHADSHEGHGMAGEQHGMCELARDGHGIVCVD